MERIGRADDVALMIFSEFGRRVPENTSLGTDACRNNGVRSEAGRILQDSLLSVEKEADSPAQPSKGLIQRSSIEPQNMTAPSSQASSMDARANDSTAEAST